MKEYAGHPRVRQKPFKFCHQAAVTDTLLSANMREKSRYDAGQRQPRPTTQGGLEPKWAIRVVWHWVRMASFLPPLGSVIGCGPSWEGGDLRKGGSVQLGQCPRDWLADHTLGGIWVGT